MKCEMFVKMYDVAGKFVGYAQEAAAVMFAVNNAVYEGSYLRLVATASKRVELEVKRDGYLIDVITKIGDDATVHHWWIEPQTFNALHDVVKQFCNAAMQ